MLLLLGSSHWACAAEVQTDLDFMATPRLLKSHFGRYGYQPASTIAVKDGVVQFQLPGGPEVGQTGLYSYVSLAGDFEVSAVFAWDEVEYPQGGYGVSCGIAVEDRDTGKSVSLARGFLLGKGQGPGYIVVQGEPGEKGMNYEAQHFPTRSQNGRLVLRREKNEIICLAAETSEGEPKELCRLAYTPGTVRPLRIFADNGGSPTGLSVRLGFIRIHADEIAAGNVQHEQGGGAGWWIVGAFLIGAGALGSVRYFRGSWPWVRD